MAYYVNGSVTVGIYTRTAGVWTWRANHLIFIYQYVGGGGAQTVSWYDQADFNLPAGIDGIGVSVESHTGVSAAVADFVSAQWTATATSGERSATPNGELTTVTVSPK